MEERGEMRRMQREQERERRRIRDRERRQSMTQEQRERHLARRRRNYQLRRQRAANNIHNSNNNNTTAFFPLEAEAEAEAATSTSHDPTIFHTHHLPLLYLPHTQSGQESSSLRSHNRDGSGVHMEVLTYKPTNSTGRLRLNHIRQLARNLIHPVADHHTQTGIHQVVPHVIAKGDLSSQGSTLKSLRLNRVKQLARSLGSPSKLQNGTVREAANNITYPETYGDGFKCC